MVAKGKQEQGLVPKTAAVKGEFVPDEHPPERETRVFWYPPNPAHVYSLAGEAMEDNGQRILAKVLRELAKCAAQDERRPHTYSVPEPPDVIAMLEGVKDDIDFAIHILNTHDEPLDALTADLPERFKIDCAECGKTYIPERTSQAKFCSNACRQRDYRKRKRESSDR